jgi:hypothetical protein
MAGSAHRAACALCGVCMCSRGVGEERERECEGELRRTRVSLLVEDGEEEACERGRGLDQESGSAVCDGAHTYCVRYAVPHTT